MASRAFPAAIPAPAPPAASRAACSCRSPKSQELRKTALFVLISSNSESKDFGRFAMLFTRTSTKPIMSTERVLSIKSCTPLSFMCVYASLYCVMEDSSMRSSSVSFSVISSFFAIADSLISIAFPPMASPAFNAFPFTSTLSREGRRPAVFSLNADKLAFFLSIISLTSSDSVEALLK